MAAADARPVKEESVELIVNTNPNEARPEISRRHVLKTSTVAASAPGMTSLTAQRAAFATGD